MQFLAITRVYNTFVSTDSTSSVITMETEHLLNSHISVVTYYTDNPMVLVYVASVD